VNGRPLTFYEALIARTHAVERIGTHGRIHTADFFWNPVLCYLAL
jgi:hypothetical protein